MQAPILLTRYAGQIETLLEEILRARQTSVPDVLWNAMHYSLMAGGKRVRPALLLACFHACGGKQDIANLAAASIECMHTYSLIHDDLPCMDDDDLRRGKPTCHIQFNEETAVLAGDALQALSFELLTELDVAASVQLQLLKRLAFASGAQGMVGGQVMDMQSEGLQDTDLLRVEQIHIHKTGSLLTWCCEAGALLANASDAEFEACSRYGKAVGLLFQVADDILDATANAQTLGKSAGKDACQHKATYVSVLGVTQARELAQELCEVAEEACAPLAEQGEPLKALARYILERGQ